MVGYNVGHETEEETFYVVSVRLKKMKNGNGEVVTESSAMGWLGPICVENGGRDVSPFSFPGSAHHFQEKPTDDEIYGRKCSVWYHEIKPGSAQVYRVHWRRERTVELV